MTKGPEVNQPTDQEKLASLRQKLADVSGKMQALSTEEQMAAEKDPKEFANLFQTQTDLQAAIKDLQESIKPASKSGDVSQHTRDSSRNPPR
ncbi:hypothetical protein A2W14_06250 [Candidatus Gottesmanbacteria bacterium RBG_16_37_8]|uniref:Uncharacterized protein n=1 Tax=Candidatus Gottesmanbacteria bacterium RBG_16_37_8 TaxID=1798371 RepID=A0A1F5YV98_9BACT|nr:MAG: hypothetical protein A2W14_06250 [Candidatus Gottesmanbacteria bacterium RBG_16_37_8]